MPKDTREPQSYGSEQDWVTGKTGQEVNEQASAPPAEHQDFYDERREAEDSAPAQGGKTSPFQLAENQQASGGTPGVERVPINGVTTQRGGAKRGSYFRKRDYE
ncbi:MAG: hypothetical protein M3Q69_01925 [Acidobacteriota bacterium]|nr:hypothetical protein [Acidobacteriota bacterium]